MVPWFNPTKMPIVLFQSMLGFLAGFFLGLLTTIVPTVIETLHLYSTKGAFFICAVLLLMGSIPIHFMINGNIRGLRNKQEITEVYSGPPTAFRIRLAQISFWALAILGLLLGMTTEHDLFFGPF